MPTAQHPVESARRTRYVSNDAAVKSVSNKRKSRINKGKAPRKALSPKQRESKSLVIISTHIDKLLY